jgi:hypothetical protein
MVSNFMNGFADELIKLGQSEMTMKPMIMKAKQPEMTFSESEVPNYGRKPKAVIRGTGSAGGSGPKMSAKTPSRMSGTNAKPPTGDALLAKRDALFNMRRQRKAPPTGDALLAKRDALFNMRRKRKGEDALLAKRDKLFDMRRKIRASKSTVAAK